MGRHDGDGERARSHPEVQDPIRAGLDPGRHRVEDALATEDQTTGGKVGALLRHAGQTLTRDQLLGRTMPEVVGTLGMRALEPYVRRLRPWTLVSWAGSTVITNGRLRQFAFGNCNTASMEMFSAASAVDFTAQAFISAML